MTRDELQTEWLREHCPKCENNLDKIFALADFFSETSF